MQFQVPQFIETEDRIGGVVTIRQFIYLCITGGVVVMLYFVLNTIVWAIIAAPLGALGLAIALVKVNGQSFLTVLGNALRYYWNPQVYIWQPDHPQVSKAQVVRESGYALEDLIAGLALKSAWQQVQTGSPTSDTIKRSMASIRERYEIVSRITGARKAARRVDYR